MCSFWRNSSVWHDHRESCIVRFFEVRPNSVQVLATPNYLKISNLQTICPVCGPQFNSAVTRMSQFGVGMIMAGIFTLQLMPILVAIPPAMVRSSVMMLVHPAISRERDTGKQKQLREKLMLWLHLHASKRENDRSSRFLSRSSSTESIRSSLLSIEKAQRLIARFCFAPTLTLSLGKKLELPSVQH